MRVITSSAVLKELANTILKEDHKKVRREILSLFKFIERKFHGAFKFDICNLRVDFDYPETSNCERSVSEDADNTILACSIKKYKGFIRIVLSCDDLVYCIQDYKMIKRSDCTLTYFCPNC